MFSYFFQIERYHKKIKNSDGYRLKHCASSCITSVTVGRTKIFFLQIGLEWFRLINFTQITLKIRKIISLPYFVSQKIEESLTLPLIRNLRQLRDLCNKSKSEQTLLELNTFKFHIDYLSSMRSEQWTQEMLKTHIFIVIQQEMDNILKVLNPKITEPLDKNQESTIRKEWTKVLSLLAIESISLNHFLNSFRKIIETRRRIYFQSRRRNYRVENYIAIFSAM